MSGHKDSHVLTSDSRPGVTSSPGRSTRRRPARAVNVAPPGPVRPMSHRAVQQLLAPARSRRERRRPAQMDSD